MIKKDIKYLSGEGFYQLEDASTEYWGEIPKNSFDQLIKQLKESDDFDASILNYFRNSNRADLYEYNTDIRGRCSWNYLMNKDHYEVTVDLGAGMGAISEYMSSKSDIVYAIEGGFERCQFIAQRKRIKKIQNLEIIHGNIYDLPFEDNSVDIVICNGVLEWVAIGRNGNVRDIQKKFLREINRILKDDGILYIGIENRFGYQLIKGGFDHTGTRYTSLMPRWMANFFIKDGNNTGFVFNSKYGKYRTYTYSSLGYKKLLKQSSFNKISIFKVNHSYDIPKYAFKLKIRYNKILNFLKIFCYRGVLGTLIDILFPTNYFIFASKTNDTVENSLDTVFFGYMDYIELQENNKIKRTCIIDEAVVYENLYEGRTLDKISQDLKTQITDKNIVEAYKKPTYYSFKNHTDFEQIKNQVERFIRPYIVNNETIDYILKGITRCLIKNDKFHGDFWLGNLILEKNTNSEIIPIDGEKQLFGSKELDFFDFALDFIFNNREIEFKNININNLLKEVNASLNDKELVYASIARQILRYSPCGRSNALVYRYLQILCTLETDYSKLIHVN